MADWLKKVFSNVKPESAYMLGLIPIVGVGAGLLTTWGVINASPFVAGLSSLAIGGFLLMEAGMKKAFTTPKNIMGGLKLAIGVIGLSMLAIGLGGLTGFLTPEWVATIAAWSSIAVVTEFFIK